MQRMQFSMCLTLVSGLLVLGLFAITAQAGEKQRSKDASTLRWERIAGLIEPSGLGALVGRRSGSDPCEEPTRCVRGARAPWLVTRGNASVDFASSEVAFRVRGLVVAGDPFFETLGTTSVVTQVKGTLVCNDTAPGDVELVDTEAVALSPRGNARFRGPVDLPASCADEPEDIAFLIRIAGVREPIFEFLLDTWIAFGAIPTLSGEDVD